MARDVQTYLAELKLLTGRQNTNFDLLIYEWFNDLFEMLETDPEKMWFFDKTVQFTLGVSDIGANGAIIEVPEDYEHKYHLAYIDGASGEYTVLNPIADLDAKKKYGAQDSGAPVDYSEEGDSIRFWPPSPDATYTIEMSYKAKLTRVSIPTDINDFMDNYHGVIVDGLRAKVWEYLGQDERAASYWAKWAQKWADMRASEVARVLSGEVMFLPRTDVNGRTTDERGGNRLTWGGN
jgi:hypothetical protein